MEPCGLPTRQNCVPEEQYPCLQVTEEQGTGPKTGALKGPKIMFSGSLPGLAVFPVSLCCFSPSSLTLTSS